MGPGVCIQKEYIEKKAETMFVSTSLKGSTAP